MAGGLFYAPSPERIHTILLREYILRLVPSEHLTFDDRLEGQFIHRLNLVEDVLHFLGRGDKLAFLAVQFVLDHIAAIALLGLDVRLEVDNRYLAVLQVAQGCEVALKPLLPVSGLVRDA